MWNISGGKWPPRRVARSAQEKGQKNNLSLDREREEYGQI